MAGFVTARYRLAFSEVSLGLGLGLIEKRLSQVVAALGSFGASTPPDGPGLRIVHTGRMETLQDLEDFAKNWRMWLSSIKQASQPEAQEPNLSRVLAGSMILELVISNAGELLATLLVLLQFIANKKAEAREQQRLLDSLRLVLSEASEAAIEARRTAEVEEAVRLVQERNDGLKLDGDDLTRLRRAIEGLARFLDSGGEIEVVEGGESPEERGLIQSTNRALHALASEPAPRQLPSPGELDLD